MGYEPVVVLFYYEPLSGAAVGGDPMLVAASHYPLLFAPFRGGVFALCPIVGRGCARICPLWGEGVCIMPHCGARVPL